MAVVDPQTGMLANQWCPVKQRQYFKPGTEPTEVCNVHTEPAPVDTTPMDIPGGIPIPEPVQKGVEGIGKVLRRIFHF